MIIVLSKHSALSLVQKWQHVLDIVLRIKIERGFTLALCNFYENRLFLARNPCSILFHVLLNTRVTASPHPCACARAIFFRPAAVAEYLNYDVKFPISVKRIIELYVELLVKNEDKSSISPKRCDGMF